MPNAPLHEALFIAALSLALALALPFAARWLFVRLSKNGWRLGMLAAGAGFAIALARLGGGSLGPALVDSPDHWADLVLRLVVATASFGLSALLCRRQPNESRPASVVGLMIAVVSIALVMIVERQSIIESDEVADATEGEAMWRLTLEPWDGTAALALAHQYKTAGALVEAASLLEHARAHGADETAAHVLEAEIHAINGDCDKAREAFDASLVSRARTMIERGEHLELGGYELPESLVTRCALTRP